MKKSLVLFLLLSMSASSIVFAAKYTVNSSGTVKNQAGKIITSPANSVNQNYYQQVNTVVSPAQTNSVPSSTMQQSYGVSPSAQSTQVMDNYFNNYQAQNYITNNHVNDNSVGIVEFVMDYSGSMSNWIEVAKRSMSAILLQIPTKTKVGFRVFGHDYYGKNPNGTVKEVKKIIKQGNKFKVVTERGCLGSTSGACAATQMVAPITDVNINSLLGGMNSVNLGGATPLVYALDRVVNQDLSVFDTTTPKKIVLITDGGENCGGNPCAFARKLMQKRSDIHIDVVLVSSNSRALACLSDTTGGHFYTVNNLADFSTIINNSVQSVPTIQSQVNNQQYEYIGE